MKQLKAYLLIGLFLAAATGLVFAGGGQAAGGQAGGSGGTANVIELWHC